MITNTVAGIAFMSALNLTVAVGTLNGILFCAYNIIVAVNADTYLFLFLSLPILSLYSYRGLISIILLALMSVSLKDYFQIVRH